MLTKINAADTAVIGTWGATAFAWLAEVNEVLQFVVLVFGIVSAIYAILVHRKHLREK